VVVEVVVEVDLVEMEFLVLLQVKNVMWQVEHLGVYLVRLLVLQIQELILLLISG
jgi:hypothetical protein